MSVDAGLRAVKGRHNLAVLLTEAGRDGEAGDLWRAALAHDPQFAPALVGLGELHARGGDAAGLAEQVAALRALGPDGAGEAAALAARGLLARGDVAGAAGESPASVAVRVAVSHVRLAEGPRRRFWRRRSARSWTSIPRTPRPGTTWRSRSGPWASPPTGSSTHRSLPDQGDCRHPAVTL